MPNHNMIAELGQCYTGVVHDVLRKAGFSNFTLPSEMKPLLPDRVLCGPVFTIEGQVDESAEDHQTLLEWTGLLSKAKSGYIWVSQPHDQRVAHMGELSSEALIKKGVLGCVIDGGIRDTHCLKEQEFQAWHRFHTPRDVVGYWLPTGFDVDIIIGDVIIQPADFLLGDLDGLLRVPKAHVRNITEKAQQAMKVENKVRTAILGGVDPQKAYLRYGKF